MKRIVSLVLCLALLGCEFQSSAKPPPAPAREKQVGQNTVVLGLFILCCVSVGAYLIWKIREANPPVGSKVTLALDKSYDLVNWTTVCTNTVILTDPDWKMMFQQEMNESRAYYKVRLVK